MAVTTADVNFDMYDREIYASPYAVYRRLRDEAPLYYNEAVQVLRGEPVRRRVAGAE